ncbi:hypothetical protein HCH_01100 [Hahella chejuensis KCTC 2396]|uniref:Uncharacterized protein n=1 Tax=Hahella chejuensis (strain KCTC 2396) TaxID=349521 RepID=Q2SMZ4_HAHCH|nr:hypothetical protein HCH_01100 [Hahella chejuensis KCTC 2396]
MTRVQTAYAGLRSFRMQIFGQLVSFFLFDQLINFGKTFANLTSTQKSA